jgi:hypothetical protein
LGAWGISTIRLGKSVIQARIQREEFCMGKYNSFRLSMFCMNNKERVENKSLELKKPWRENYGVYLEKNIEEPGFHA